MVLMNTFEDFRDEPTAVERPNAKKSLPPVDDGWVPPPLVPENDFPSTTSAGFAAFLRLLEGPGCWE